MAASVALVAAVFLLCVTFSLFEPDFWEHLLVGRVIWQTHSVPDQEIWTWPAYGAPAITPSWLFTALIWPVWSIAGVWGLFVWRWATTLLAFGLAWATGRVMGARGFAALAVLIPVALSYQTRSQIRPETLVIVLIALQLWVLETRRSGGSDRSMWVVAIAWIWANAHISYYLGFVILGAYLIDDALRARRGAAADRARLGRLALVAVASLAISFVNPFGWRALWEPFDFVLHMQHETLFQNVRELQPFSWRQNMTNGFTFLVFGWPLLIAWRLLKRRFDPVELILCLVFTAMVFSARRFIGFHVVAATPFLMRGVAEVTAAIRNTGRVPVAARAGAVALLCAIVVVKEVKRGWPPIGVNIDQRYFPIGACDFIDDHDVRGRFFNQFYDGGYLLYRFWPDRGRLPFLDIHQAGGPEIRRAYMDAVGSPRGFRPLDEQQRFDVALVDRKRVPGSPVLDELDADSTWALVFVDDAAAVFVRRGGSASNVAEHLAYRWVPGGPARVSPLGAACARDPVLRAEVEAELRRAVASSPWNSWASSLLGSMAFTAGRMTEARAHLEHALAVDPRTGKAHERLGMIAFATGRPGDAVHEFELERSRGTLDAGLALRLGKAWRRVGDDQKARAWYRRALAMDPANREATDSLRVLGGG